MYLDSMDKEHFRKYYQLHKVEYKERNKRWREKHGDEVKKNRKEWILNHPHIRKKQVKRHRLKVNYGMTLDEYNNLMTNQNNCCKICKKPQSFFKRSLAVDHNHTTNKVRGLLCHKCNLILGYCEENPIILKSAIEYLSA